MAGSGETEQINLGPVQYGQTDVVGHDMLLRRFESESAVGQIELDLVPESLNHLYRLQVMFHEGDSQLSGLGSFEARGVQLKKLVEDERAKRLVHNATGNLERMRTRQIEFAELIIDGRI